jgi:signal transduction histidine kinase
MAEPESDTIRKLRHDLSNPLAAILAETQLLLLDEAKLDADTVQGLKEIEALSRRMRDMLAATRTAG